MYEFDDPSDVDRDMRRLKIYGTMSAAEHARREIKARRALRRWESDRGNAKAVHHLAQTGRHKLAVEFAKMARD